MALTLLIGALAQLRLRWVRQQAQDFEFFYHGGAALLDRAMLDDGLTRNADGTIEHRGTIEWYPPFVSRLMTLPVSLGRMMAPEEPTITPATTTATPIIASSAPTTTGGPAASADQPADQAAPPPRKLNTTTLIPQTAFRGADLVWLIAGLAALLAVLRLIGRRLPGLAPDQWPAWVLLPLLAGGLFIHWEFRLNQVNVLTLLLMLGALVCWEARRPRIAGFWLGLAALLKITPAGLIAWFALKRQWRTVTFAILTIFVAGPLSDAVAFMDTGYFRDVYRQWLGGMTRSSQAALIRDDRELDWRNAGIGAALARTLTHTSYATRIENDPRARRYNEPPAYANLLDLPRGAVSIAATGLSAGLLLGLMWLTRRPAAELTTERIRVEWAVWLLALLCIMPVLRRYHLVWALPALALLAAQAYRADSWRRAWAPALALALAAALQAWALLGTMSSPAAPEVFGLFPLALIVMGVVLLRSTPASSTPPTHGRVAASAPGVGPITPRPGAAEASRG
ncbi:MAG: DUF2029 domain-containing protein [Phycisphaerales bacterium]|nr:DUF2029 domain-containing protein [Phycisphaerales bacterium]